MNGVVLHFKSPLSASYLVLYIRRSQLCAAHPKEGRVFKSGQMVISTVKVRGHEPSPQQRVTLGMPSKAGVIVIVNETYFPPAGCLQ